MQTQIVIQLHSRDFVLKQIMEGRVMVDGVWQELLSDSLFIEHDVASRYAHY